MRKRFPTGLGGLGLALAACGPSAVQTAPQSASMACVVLPDGTVPALDTVAVAIADPPGLPNVARLRFVMRQTAVLPDSTDCDGRPETWGTVPPAKWQIDRSDSLVTELSPAGGPGPMLRFVSLPTNVDARDALDGPPRDGRIDVLVTRDPATIAFGRGRSDFQVAALAWDRTYVALVSGDSGAVVPTASERDALARDAVRNDARGATPPFWWTDRPCLAPESAPSAPRAPVVAYVRGDPIAADLAQRVLALLEAPGGPLWLAGAAARGSAALRLLAMDPPALGGVTRANGVVVIAALPRGPAPACDWELAIPHDWTTKPLVDSRAHAIVRRGAPGFRITNDGTFVFLPEPATR